MELPPLTTGWYPDPSGWPGRLRYYEDYEWTERTADAPPGSPGIEYFDVPSYLSHLTLPPLSTNLDDPAERPKNPEAEAEQGWPEEVRPAWEAFKSGVKSAGVSMSELITGWTMLLLLGLAVWIRNPTTIFLAVIAAVAFYLATTRRKRRRRRESRHIPREVLGEVFRRDAGCCVECGSTESLEVDHIIPYSLGGATSADNLQLLCRDCNRRKSDNI